MTPKFDSNIIKIMEQQDKTLYTKIKEVMRDKNVSYPVAQKILAKRGGKASARKRANKKLPDAPVIKQRPKQLKQGEFNLNDYPKYGDVDV